MNWLTISYGFHGDPRRESTFLVCQDFAKAVAARGDVVYSVVPRRLILKGELEAIPNVEYVGEEAGRTYWEDGVTVPLGIGALFSRALGLHPVDAVFTPKLPAVPALRAMLQHDVEDEVPVINFIPGMADLLKRSGGSSSERAAAMQLVALGLAGSVPVFLQEEEKRLGVEMARKVVAPWLVDRIIQQSRLTPGGLDFAALELFRGVEKNESPVVFYGARVNGAKNSRKVFDLVKRVYASGRQFEFWVVSSTPEEVIKNYMMDRTGPRPRVVKVDDLERVFLRPDTRRSEYLEIAARTHVALYWSQFEGFPIGFWEQMYLGVICLMPDQPWVRATMPADYPFIFDANDETAAFAMLTSVLDDYPEAKVRFDAAMPAEFIREKLDAAAVWNKMRDWGAEAAEPAKARLKMARGERDEVFLPALGAQPDEFTLHELLGAMSKAGRCWPIDPVLRGQWHRASTNYVVHCELERQGYGVVRLRGKHPVYSKGAA